MYDLAGTATFPTFETDIQNSLGVIRFDGSANPLTQADTFTFRHLFLVAKYDGATFSGTPGIVTNTAGTIGLYGVNAGTAFASVSGMGSVNWTAYVNGVSQVVTAIPAPVSAFKLIRLSADADVSMAGLVVGRKGTAGDKWNGDFCELFFCGAELETNIREIEEHLMGKWGL